MKQFSILIIAAFCVLASCNNADQKTTDSTMSSSDNEKAQKMDANMKEVYRAIETGDVSKLDSFIAKDVVDHEVKPDGNEIHGLDSVKAFLGDIHNHFSDLKFDVITSATNGDYHFTLIHFTGTTKDNVMAPANTKIDEKNVDVVRIKDGKGVEHWGFRDVAAVDKMMRSMPQPPPKK